MMDFQFKFVGIFSFVKHRVETTDETFVKSNSYHFIIIINKFAAFDTINSIKKPLYIVYTERKLTP